MVASQFHSLAECPFFPRVLSSKHGEKEDSDPHYCSWHTALVEIKGLDLEL